MKVKHPISLTPEQKKFVDEEAKKIGMTFTGYVQSLIIKQMQNNGIKLG